MSYFVFQRRVAYHETDAMGVVHHSNHIKYFEEARVAWLRERGLMNYHAPYGPYVFAVTSLETNYRKPAFFDNDLQVWLQSRMEGSRILFQYALVSEGQVIADGRTTLVPIDAAFKPSRLPAIFKESYSRESWDDVWPPKSFSK